MSDFLRDRDGALTPLVDGLTLGRNPSSGLVLDLTSVSRDHAVVRAANGRWYVEDRGSRNGTSVNGAALAFGQPHPLRHDDLVRVGDVELLVVCTSDLADPERTDSLAADREYRALGLSPFQHQVLMCLAEPWAAGGEPATNAEIAVRLGTPSAVDAVKAAVRRIYAKAGLAEDTSRGKRRELCRIARHQGWI